MLVGFPAKFSIIYTNPRIPMHTVILFITPIVFKHFHAPALCAICIKIGFKFYGKKYRRIRHQWSRQHHFQDGIIQSHIGRNTIHLHTFHFCALALGFVFAKLLFEIIGQIQLLQVRAFYKCILVQMKIHKIQSIVGVVIIGQLF